MKLSFHPLTPARWPHLARLFGPKGAWGGCWCMWWRLPRREFERCRGAANRRAFRGVVKKGPPPGVLAYVDGEPAAWCCVAPREDFPVVENSRTLRRVDDRPVWSVVCLYIAKPHRRRGLSVPLLAAAARHARARGARIVEGYPVEPRHGRWQDAWVWTGVAGSFRKAGFVEVARRTRSRPIMRWPASAAGAGRSRRARATPTARTGRTRATAG